MCEVGARKRSISYEIETLFWAYADGWKISVGKP